jgi:DNA-binding MarR family transcriptional regulator
MNHDTNPCFLLADIGRLMRQRFQQQLDHSELTYAQARALINISRYPGLRQVELAELMGIQPITPARLIDQLQQQQLVERRADPADRRAYRLHTTAAAQSPLQQIRQIGAVIYEQMMDGLDARQRDELALSLAKAICCFNWIPQNSRPRYTAPRHSWPPSPPISRPGAAAMPKNRLKSAWPARTLITGSAKPTTRRTWPARVRYPAPAWMEHVTMPTWHVSARWR